MKDITSFILCILEYILKWEFLSGEFRTEAGGVFLWDLPHSWGGEEESLTSFSGSQHMLAFMGFIYSTSQGSTKRSALWGDIENKQGDSGKPLLLLNGWKSDHQIARSRYWDSSRCQYETFWFHLIICNSTSVPSGLEKGTPTSCTGRYCLFTPANCLAQGHF